jgi:hypothetical protein
MSYVTKNPGKRPKYDYNNIKKLLLEGKDYTKISSELGCPARVVRYVRFKYKINIQKNSYKQL